MRTRTRPIKRRLVVKTEFLPEEDDFHDNGRLLQPQEVLPTGAAQQEVVQGRFGLVFGLKMRGYFDSIMNNEPYFALRSVIARSVTSKPQLVPVLGLSQ